MVTFRETSTTVAAAVALLTEYFGSRELSFPSSMGEYRATFPDPEAFEPPRGEFVVVEDVDLAGEPADVGCGGIRQIDGGLGSRLELKHLWLQPHLRGRGFGRLLLAELERRAIELGATELVLDTNTSLEAAGGLYRSSGYEEIEPFNDNPNANLWLRKVLPRTEPTPELPNTLTLEEAFRAALFMIEGYGDVESWESQDIVLLHQYMVSDPARWDDWQNAVVKALDHPEISSDPCPRD